MNKNGLYYHPSFLNHNTGHGHPERPERLRTLMSHLLNSPVWKKLDHLQPSPANREWIHLVHPEEYVGMIETRCRRGDQILDSGDTHVCRESFDIALIAAGGVIEAVDQVLGGKLVSAFCAGRPPGHHAGTSTVMGFCLFNNIAIGARYAQKNHGIRRVAIVDWDVHHGNGTQEIFYEDDSVLFVSLHQYPFYPGTGAKGERGRGRGEGFTVNIPMNAGSGEREYVEAFDVEVIPTLNAFRPELLMISAGFDAHRDDPLAQIELTDCSYGILTEKVRGVAEKHCGGRIVSVLEGGYDLQALARSVEKHLEALLS